MKNDRKQAGRALGCLALAVSVTLAGAETHTSIPSWVRPGMEVIYDGGARFIGPSPSAITALETTRVHTVSGGLVSGTTNLRNGANPLQSNFSWTCVEGGPCTGYPAQFWVDPQNPTASIRGPFGEPFQVVARGPVSYGGRTWNATAMTYSNPDSGTEYVVIFDTASGLLLAYTESSPSQQTYRHFRTLSEP